MPDNKYTLEDILAEYDNKKSIKESSISDTSTFAPKPVLKDVTSSAVQCEPEKKDKVEISSISENETLQGKVSDEKKEQTHTSGIRVQSNSPLKLRIEQYSFLFKQLVKRDFKGRYKRAALGVLWSMLSPMFTFAAQAIIFSVLFKRGEHYISYLIVGNVVFHYFTDSANSGMFSMAGNGGILSKINVPKSIFLLSKSVSCLMNFLLTMIVMFIITAIDGIVIKPMCTALIIPMTLMTVFNLGVGFALSSWFVFFKDTQYLFSIFTQVLMYFSAIFYRITSFPESVSKLFYLNPIYCYITYFRMVIIDGVFPSFKLNIACAFYALIMLLFGIAIYKKSNNKFVFYF